MSPAKFTNFKRAHESNLGSAYERDKAPDIAAAGVGVERRTFTIHDTLCHHSDHDIENLKDKYLFLSPALVLLQLMKTEIMRKRDNILASKNNNQPSTIFYEIVFLHHHI